MKILFIGPSNIGPYHFARLNSLCRFIPAVVFMRVKIKEQFRPWQDDRLTRCFEADDFARYRDTREILQKHKPGLVVFTGYKNLPFLKVSFWAKRYLIPVVVQFDSTFIDYPRNRVKELLKSWIIRYCFDGAFVAGSRSASYIESLGIDEKAVWHGVDVVDNAHFDERKCVIGLPSNFPEQFFLVVSRFSQEKNIFRLFQAFESYKKNGGRWGLFIVGSGPLEERLKRSVPEKLKNFIHFYGWSKYEDLPKIYQRASCFVLPSISEPWGLVVNEAMAAGLPILISCNCGCSPELCKEEKNGFTFNPLDIKQIAKLMERVSNGGMDLKAMGEESKRIISKYSVENWVVQILSMVKTLTDKIKGDNK